MNITFDPRAAAAREERSWRTLAVTPTTWLDRNGYRLVWIFFVAGSIGAYIMGA